MAGLRRLLPFLRIPVVLLAVGLFFSFYNRFLVSSNLQNLKTSLSVLDAATGVGQAEAALLLVDQTLVTAMAQEELDLKAVAALQYAQGVLSAEERGRPVVDAQVMIADLAREQRASRTGALGALDAIASGVGQTVSRAFFFPRQIGAKKGTEEVDSERLAQAARWERSGLLSEAAQAYEELLRQYPDYVGRTSLKLRLGYVYQRKQEFDQADRLFREGSRESRDPKGAAVAQELLRNLDKARKQRKAAQELQKKIEAMGSGPERQKTEFELGSLWVQLYAMEKAAETFQTASVSDPEGDLVLPSLFKQGWCLRTLGRFKEALQVFEDLIGRDPTSSWAAAAQQQMAEAHKAMGDYTKSMQVYEKLLATSRDSSLKAMALAQAGSTALYDLKNPQGARGYFQQLTSQFPASSVSAIEQDISRLETAKAALTAAAQPLAPGAPLLGWIERTLPAFAQTFADRLARYMESVGETKLTRRYSENEFRNIVLRRVEERFPGQIREVQVSIRSTGYVGSCVVRLGPISFSLDGRIGIFVANERPHLSVPEMRIWKVPVPEALRKQLAQRVNQSIDNLRLPIQVTQYDFSEGYVVITAERVVR